jgi:hypothetical protein
MRFRDLALPIDARGFMLVDEGAERHRDVPEINRAPTR